MNIETVEELSDQIADWIGIYGGCKNSTETDNHCSTDPKKPFCCRQGFLIEISERLKKAVENDNKLKLLNQEITSTIVSSENDVISNLSEQLKWIGEMGNDMEGKSWGSEEGVLLTGNESLLLINGIKDRDKEIARLKKLNNKNTTSVEKVITPSIPEWILKYDKNNYQSSAGKAIRQLINIINREP